MESTAARSWERPWTAEEMRQQSANWSLAGDAGLLNHLEQFSQGLLTRTHSTNQKMDALFEDLRSTSTEVSNVTNSFLSLSNTQFVESRVYDDEDKETPKEEVKVQELSEEQHRAQISEALTLGMSVLDTMFDVVQVCGSDSEDEESSSSAIHSILEPKNPYMNRPLPYLIGSKEFIEDDKIGLGDPNSITDDNNSLEPTHSSDGEQDPVLNKVVSSSSECSDLENDLGGSKSHSDLLFPPSMPGKSNRQPESLFDEPEEAGDMFGQKSPQADSPPIQVKSQNQNSFVEELASKLGGVTDHNQQEKVSHPVRPSRKLSGDLFSPAEDDEDSLFGSSGGKFSTKSGLFDDIEQPSKPPASSRLENKVSVPVKKTIEFSDDLFNASDQEADDIFSVTPAKKHSVVVAERETGGRDKKPPGGVSIFGADLFGPSENVQDAPKRLLSVPDDKGGIFTSTPDSQIHEDSDGLFGTGISQNISNVKTNLSLFANVDEDDLFSPSKPKVNVKVSNSAEQSTGVSKKLQASAGSIFGQDLFSKSTSASDSKNHSKSPFKSPLEQKTLPSLPSNASSDSTIDRSFIQTSTDTSSGLGQASEISENESRSQMGEESLFNPRMSSTRLKSANSNSFINQHSASSLFKEEFPSDSLFQNTEGILGRPINPPTLSGAIKKNYRKPVSLFDSDSDESDLFSRTSSPSIRSVDKVEHDKKLLQKSTLFADDQLCEARASKPNFDIFGSENSAKSKLPVSHNKDTTKKLASEPIFDIFGPEKTEAKTTVSLGESTVSKVVEKTRNFPEDVNDIDIFATRNTDKKLDIKSSKLFDFEDGVVDDIFAVPKTKPKPNANLGGSLFDEVDDLFAVPRKSKTISERLFDDLKTSSLVVDQSTSIFKEEDVKKASPKPEPPTTLNIKKTVDLFSKDIKEDLFSGSAKEDMFSGSKKENLFSESPEDDLFGSSLKKEKPESKGNSTSKILKDESANKSKDTKHNIKDMLTEIVDRQVEDIFSDITQDKFKPRDLSDKAKKNEGEQFVAALPIPDKNAVKPIELGSDTSNVHSSQATPNLDTQGTVSIKPAEKPKIAPRTVKASADKSAPEMINEMPNIPARKESNKSSDEKDQNIQNILTKGLQITPVSRNMALSEEDKEHTPTLKGSKIGTQGIIKPLSINERAAIIDPTTLIPGARPSRGPQAEVAVSFEQPIVANAILHSAAKERAKIPVKRRPQSRRARQEAIRSSAIFDDDEAPSLEDISKSQDDTVLKKSTSKPSKLKSHGEQATSKQDSRIVEISKASDNAGLRQESSPQSSPGDSTSELLKATKRHSPPSLFSPETDEGEDLFGMPQDLPEFDLKEDLGGNLFGGAPVLSPPEERPSLFHSSIPDSTATSTDKPIPKSDFLKNLSKTNDNLFDSSSTIPKDSSLFAKREDIFSQVSTSDKKINSLFDDDSDQLFSSASNKVNASVKKLPELEDDLFSTDKKMDKSTTGKDWNKSKIGDNLPNIQQNFLGRDLFPKNKKYVLTKDSSEEEDLFASQNVNKVFDLDTEDSLFKATTTTTSKKVADKPPTLKTKDDLFSAKTTSVSVGNITDDLFGTPIMPVSSKPLTKVSTQIFHEQDVSPPVATVRTIEKQPKGLSQAKMPQKIFKQSTEDDLFGHGSKSLSTQPKTDDEDLFSVKSTKKDFASKIENELFGSASVSLASNTLVSAVLGKPLDEGFASSSKDNFFGTSRKPVNVTNASISDSQKSQKIPSAKKSGGLFGEPDSIEEDMFFAGAAMKKTGNVSSAAVKATVVIQGRNQNTTRSSALSKTTKKSLFDDEDDDDIFSGTMSKVAGKTPVIPGILARTSSNTKKIVPSKPASAASSKQNTDFQDPLMALKKE